MKYNITFIQDGFYLAGGQTFFFELITNFCKRYSNYYNVRIISLSDQKETDYYLDKYHELGVDVTLLAVLHSNSKNFFSRVKRKIDFLISNYVFGRYVKNEKALCSAIESSHLCVINQPYVFSFCKKYFDSRTKVFHHSMSHSWQYDSDLYANFNNRKCVLKMSYFCESQKFEMEKALSPMVNFTYFPLIRSLRFDNNRIATECSEITFATVSRVSPMRFLENFIYAAHIIAGRNVDFRFVIIGAIEDELYHNRLERLIKCLFIEKKVVFAGRSTNLKNTLAQFNVDLLWSGPLHKEVGYGSMESIAHGFPSIFWEMNLGEHKSSQGNSVYPTFNDIVRFADRSIDLVENRQVLNKLLDQQQLAVRNICSVDKWLPIIEKEYRDLIQNSF